MTLQAVAIGVAIVLAGTIPRNIVFAANLRHFTGFPWAVPVMATYMFMLLAYRTLAVVSGFSRTRGGAGVKAESTGSA